MINKKVQAELVRKAQRGDKDSLNRLAEVTRVHLYEYAFRLTFEEDLAQDIVQECILEMFESFKKLKNAEKFWAWLEGIAFYKIGSIGFSSEICPQRPPSGSFPPLSHKNKKFPYCQYFSFPPWRPFPLIFQKTQEPHSLPPSPIHVGGFGQRPQSHHRDHAKNRSWRQKRESPHPTEGILQQWN